MENAPEVPLFPEIFQWNKPKNHVPFTSRPEFPETLGKWKTLLVSKLSRENVSVENGGLRGSSIAGLKGKAERDNSQARTKRSNNIPFQWKGRFRRATNWFW